MLKRLCIPLIGYVLLSACNWPDSRATKGELEKIHVQAKSLANNIIGEPIERDVLVYVPPSYVHNLQQRYPVVYILHGWGGSANAWFSSYGGDPDAQNAMESLLARNEIQEMILVVPDVSAQHLSSWYRNSPVTGNWESYITQDLIAEIDSRYRTIPNPAKRLLRKILCRYFLFICRILFPV